MSNANDPISHCPRGQGGASFRLLKPGSKRQAPPGTKPNEAHLRNMRAKNQLKPMGRARFSAGTKYYDWQSDPRGLRASEDRR